MANECPAVTDLPRFAELPAGDPGRDHLDSCPRCLSRLATYREFLVGDGPCDPDLVIRSVDRIGEKLDEQIFGVPQSSSKPATSAILRWRSPLVRSTLGIAAALLLFFAVNGLMDKPGSIPTQLRSGQPASRVEDPLPTATNPRADGGVDLGWTAIEEADGYRVEILDSRFEVLVDFPVTAETHLQLPASRLREVLPRPGAYVWTVVALKAGDAVGRSEPSAFTFGPVE